MCWMDVEKREKGQNKCMEEKRCKKGDFAKCVGGLEREREKGFFE